MARKAAAADGDADAGPGPSSMRQYALAHTLSGHKHAVSCVAFAPGDKLLLASASADQTLALWDARSGQRLASGGGGGGGGGVMAHAQGVNCVAWNPQACYLASASDDLTAKLWDVETGACLRTLAGHTNYVFCCQFDPVGHILVSCLTSRRAPHHHRGGAPRLAPGTCATQPTPAPATLLLRTHGVGQRAPSARLRPCHTTSVSRPLRRPSAQAVPPPAARACRPPAASTRRCASGTSAAAAACGRYRRTATPSPACPSTTTGRSWSPAGARQLPPSFPAASKRAAAQPA
jgi:hypothetical protein